MNKKLYVRDRLIIDFILSAFLDNEEPRLPTRRKKKTCLLCGNKHTHNNSFCSAKCCKGYKKQKRSKK